MATKKLFKLILLLIQQKETPSDVQLHAAALRGDLIALKRLLGSGRTHVDCRDEDHTTPLILAAASGNVDCVSELIDQGADVNAKRVVNKILRDSHCSSAFIPLFFVLFRLEPRPCFSLPKRETLKCPEFS